MVIGYSYVSGMCRVCIAYVSGMYRNFRQSIGEEEIGLRPVDLLGGQSRELLLFIKIQ